MKCSLAQRFLNSPKRQILGSSNEKSLQTTASNLMKMKESSPRVENTVGKEEIARNEYFFLFPQCFQKTYTADIVKSRACLGKS